MRTQRPWYGFLYYLLGAQGTFFLWVASILGIYLTRKEALLYLLNRAPVPVTVEQLAEGEIGLQRWVRVAGLEIDLGRLADRLALDPSPQPAGRSGTDTVLVDADSPAAIAWRALFERLERLAAQPSDDPEQTALRLWALLEPLARTPERFRPHEALVVVPGTPRQPAPVSVSAQPRTASEHLEHWLEQLSNALATEMHSAGYDPALADRLLRRFERLRTEVSRLRGAVRLGAQHAGLLHRLPGSRLEHYRTRYGVEVAPFALVTGQRPHYLAAVVFGLLSACLLFLVLGLWALRQTDSADGATS
ncbi:MAG: hypothetical protein D6776_01120 [Planctomycetota bacterium]|nr:MAG: hypothetical protein D6776_01120 [Planctomycetota bacterium]